MQQLDPKYYKKATVKFSIDVNLLITLSWKKHIAKPINSSLRSEIKTCDQYL